MNKVLIASVSLVGSLLGGTAWADGALRPVHAGRMVEVSGHRLELVTSEGRLDLYVTGHDDRPLATDKAHGKVTLLTSSGKVEISLTPAGGNQLSGAGTTTGGENAAAVIRVEGLDKQLTARLPAGGQAGRQR